MIEFLMQGNDGVLKTKGEAEVILNELLSINLSVMKSLTNSKEHFNDLKDQFVMLMVDDDITNAYYENSYDRELDMNDVLKRRENK
jgi:hypothetical protein